MSSPVPGLDALPHQLRSSLLDSLHPDEVVLWAGQPGRQAPRTLLESVSIAWADLIINLLSLGAVTVGVNGVREAVHLWVPGGTLQLLFQIAAFCVIAAAGAGFFLLFWFARTQSGQRPTRTVYAVTTIRVLGFEGAPNTPYASWHIWLNELEVKVREPRPDGAGDVVFPSRWLRGFAFEGDPMFTRIPDAAGVMTIVREAVARVPSPESAAGQDSDASGQNTA